MSWITSLADLRRLLSDGPTDRLKYGKRVFGTTDGANTTFKTLEFYRATDFTDPSITAPLGVKVNGALVTVATDSPTTGEFTLSAAPPVNALVAANYYTQWWKDAELEDFLVKATEWALRSDDPTQVPPGLQPAVLSYGAQLSLKKAMLRWIENWNDVYQLENPPEKMSDFIKLYKDMADTYAKDAEAQRKQFYTRNDQNEQPLFVSIGGRVRDPMPHR